jgi:site-specific DNA-methyltransferase (adenine-specific)
MLEINKIYQGDCLILMKDIPDKSVNLILCDLPYGTSACSWDSVINLQEMWKEYKRIIADDGAIVLFSQQPFTSILISSNLEMYKYNWVWEKDNGTNFLNSHYQPLKITEDICVFGKASCSPTKTLHLRYNPQFVQGKAYTCISGKQKQDSAVVSGNVKDVDNHLTVSDGKRYPKNLIKFIRDKEKLHPTQKPVALCEYLVKTYSQENDIVLDNTCGSGTIPLACKKNNRKFIGIELNPVFVELSNKRLGEMEVSLNVFNKLEVKSGCDANDDGIPPNNKLLGILPNEL